MKRISGNIVDLHSRRIYPGTVEWKGGIIRRIVPEPGRRMRDFIAPGFVDAHIHVESSMLPPAEFARLAVVHGTVGTVSDPHEIANVLGEAGVEYMLREAARSPFHFCFGAPSCVPATPFETAGAALGVRAVTRLLARAEIGYLSEFMNFPAVLRGDADALAKIAAAKRRGKPVDGHAPGLRGAKATAYAAAGITTDHECFTLGEARDKLACGMKILIREGSAARNFEALKPLLKTHPAECMFCCDDKHPDELVRHHIDEHVRRGIASGADRLDVLACASVNPVRHYGLAVGLLREGDSADFIVFRGWRRLKVLKTFLRGELVAEGGRSRLPGRRAAVVNAFRAGLRKAEDFRVAVPESADAEAAASAAGSDPATPEAAGAEAVAEGAVSGTRELPGEAPVWLNVIQAVEGQLVTRRVSLPARPATVAHGLVAADPARDVLKLAVVNRYAAAAPVAVAFIRGFGLRSGALASSVAHDSHNIVAVGADDDSLAAAVNSVIRNRGGVCAVGPVGKGRTQARGGGGSTRRRARTGGEREECVLALPIAGLMSDRDGSAVAASYSAVDAFAKRLGSRLAAPFMTLSFMALLVIPDLKLSDKGLFSGAKGAFVPAVE